MPSNLYSTLNIRFYADSSCTHQLFCERFREADGGRQHVALDRVPTHRTVAVHNVPQFVDQKHLSKFFGHFGDVESVVYKALAQGVDQTSEPSTSKFFDVRSKPKGFHTVFLVFADTSSVQALLAECDRENSSVHVVFDTETDLKRLVGHKKYASNYRNSLVDEKELLAEIESFMKEFDAGQEAEAVRKKSGLSEPDEDGWITVGRGGKRPGIPRRLDIAEKLKKKEKNKELDNFYSFQVRESKMKHLTDLKLKFEEDKKRIAVMKESRKFKPF